MLDEHEIDLTKSKEAMDIMTNVVSDKLEAEGFWINTYFAETSNEATAKIRLLQVAGKNPPSKMVIVTGEDHGFLIETGGIGAVVLCVRHTKEETVAESLLALTRFVEIVIESGLPVEWNGKAENKPIIIADPERWTAYRNSVEGRGLFDECGYRLWSAPDDSARLN